MPLPTVSTSVSFPAGDVAADSEVLAVPLLADGRPVLITARTPFHPVDHTWPDQPADTGVVRVAGHTLTVTDCVTGSVTPGGVLEAGAEITARRGDPERVWLVLHVLDPTELPDPDALIGATARLEVDEDHRDALGAAHTACHLMAFALNAALADRWRKEAPADALGHPDFDRLAMESSRLDVGGARDEYRLGRSLRRRGFAADGLAADLPGLRERVDAVLAAWIAADAPVRVETHGDTLTARRVWHCALPEGDAHVACGGTHIRRLGELAAVTTDMTLDQQSGTLVVRTTPVPAAGP